MACKISSMGTNTTEHRAAMEAFEEAKLELLIWLKEEHIPLTPELQQYIDKIDQSSRIMGIPPEQMHEPFTIKITGESGVGKTTLRPLLLSALYANKSLGEINDMTYFRNPGTDSWDGCLTEKHRIVAFDDFNQNRDEKDLTEMILLCSRGYFMPNMSSIDPTQANTMGNKGQIVNPDVIVLCSNVRMINPVHINSKEAINRRKHIHFDVTWTPGHTVFSEDFEHMTIKLVESSSESMRTIADFGKGVSAIQQAQLLTRVVFFKHQNKQENMDKIQDRLRFRPIDDEEVKTRIEKLAQQVSGFTGVPNGMKRYLSRPRDEFHDAREADEIQPQIGGVISHLGAKAAFAIVAAMRGADVGADIWCRITALEWILHVPQSREQKLFTGFCVLVSGLASGLMLYRALNTLWAEEERKIEETNDANSGEGHVRKQHTRLIVANASQVTQPTLPDVISNNMGQISKPDGTFVSGLFVKGNVFMTVKHFFLNADPGTKWIPEGTEIRLRAYGMKEAVVVKFRSDSLAELPGDKDVVLYRMPNTVPSRATMLNKFFDGSSHLLHRKSVSIRFNGERASFHHGEVTRDQQVVQYPYMVNGEEVKIVQHDTVLTNSPTKSGDCGSPLYIDDDLMQNKLVGICIGNNPVLRNSVTVLVTRNMIETALDKLDTSDMQPGLNIEAQMGFLAGARPIKPDELFRTEVAGELPIVAVIPRTVVPARKSKILPSPLYAQVSQPTHAVPDFKQHGYRAIVDGINKYSDISTGITKEEEDLILKSEQEEFYGIPTVLPKRFLTVEEAINGMEGMPYIDSIDTSTSAGAPFVMEGTHKKTDLLVLEEGKYKPTPRLQQEIKDFEYALDNDLDTTRWTLAIGTLKDEIRPIEKVKQGKIRFFSATGLVMLIVMRQYLMPFISHVIQTRHKTYSAMGLNKASLEWDMLIKRLLEVNTVGFDLDYKAFDSRYMAEVSRMYTNFAVGFIEYLMVKHGFIATPLQLLRFRKVLVKDERIVHIVFNFLIAIPQGNASGSLNTTPRNGFGNSTYCKLTWLRRVPAPYRDLHYYRKYVRTVFYGDDALVFVHQDFMKYWNDKAHSEVMAELNITVTTGNKTDEWGARPIEQLTFLKNLTRKMGPLYVPLKQGYKEQINWIRTSEFSPPPEQACEMNCNSALREAFFYGPDEFNSLRNKILDLRPTYNLLNYHSLYSEWSQTGRFKDIDGTFSFTKHDETTRFKDTIENDIYAYNQYLQSQ